MRICHWGAVCIFLAASPLFAADLPRPIVTGLANPESVCLGPDGLAYVTEIGEFGADGDGRVSGLHTPNGLAMDGASHLLLLDFGTGILQRIKLADDSSQKVAGGFEGGDGLMWDKHGRLFVTSWKTGRVWGIPRPGQKPVLM